MNNANVHEISYKGASFSTAMQMLGKVAENGWCPVSFMDAVATHLGGQIGNSSSISGGRNADQSAHLSSPTQGTSQNSGFGLNA